MENFLLNFVATKVPGLLRKPLIATEVTGHWFFTELHIVFLYF